MKQYIKETLDSISNQTWFKNNSNYEILLGIDNCYETLNYVKNIMKNYCNLRVFMMKSNKGTYITTNTLMTIAKYDNLLRFDSDDIMKKNMVEILMNESEKNDIDKLNFNMKNFGRNKKKKKSGGQFLLKHNVFDWFGGFLPWICAADGEFEYRIHRFIIMKSLNQILFYRRVHSNSLTKKKSSNYHSLLRKALLFRVVHISSKIQNFDEAVINTVVNQYYEVFTNTV